MCIGQIDVLERDRAVCLNMTRRDRDVFLDRAGDDRRSSSHDGRRVVGARNRDRDFNDAGIWSRCRGHLDLEGDSLAVVQKIELLAIEGNDACGLVDVKQRFQKSFAEIADRADCALDDGAAGDEWNTDIVERRTADIRVVDLDHVLEVENPDRRSKRLIRENRERRKLRLCVVESPRGIWLTGNGIDSDARNCDDLRWPEVLQRLVERKRIDVVAGRAKSGFLRLRIGVVRIVVREVQLEDFLDQGLRRFLIRKRLELFDRRRRLTDAANRNIGHLPGLRHRADQLAGRLVVEIVGTRVPIRLDQHRKFCRSVIRADFHQHRRTANTHRGNRRLDAHVAVLGGLSRNESNGALNQADQR